MGPSPMDGGNSRKHIMSAVEGSLRRLQTDYIDLYQLHGYDRNTPIDETLCALDDLVHSGKVRYVGCSNFLTYQLVRAIGRSETLRLARFDSVQPRYNLLFRQIEREMLPFCEEDGVGVISYNPIAGGLLSGKHNRTAPPPEGSRFTLGNAGAMYQERYWHERCSTPSRRCASWPTRPGSAWSRCRSPGCSPTRRSPRRSSAPAGPSSSTPQPGRRGVRARPRPEAAPRRPHPRVPDGRRRPLRATRGYLRLLTWLVMTRVVTESPGSVTLKVPSTLEAVPFLTGGEGVRGLVELPDRRGLRVVALDADRHAQGVGPLFTSTISSGEDEAKASTSGSTEVAATMVVPKCGNRPAPVNIPIASYSGMGVSEV